MSKAYRELTKTESNPTTTKEMREHCKRPGTMDENGNPIYFTEQAHKDICNVNNIIKKYDKTGIITHVSQFEAQYGDMTGMDFKQAQDLVLGAQKKFDELPSKIRKYFDNTPEKLLEFMENPDNREKAIELGLINPNWTELTDGLGEHIKIGENEKKPDSLDTTSALE